MKRKRSKITDAHPKEYNRDLFRMVEKRIAFFALHTCPERPGKQSKLIESQEDIGVYYEGVMVALGMMNTGGLELNIDTWQDAMEGGDMKAMKILMEASEDVKRAKEGISNKAKHVVCLIKAKLEIESSLGCLPTQAAVKKRAQQLYKEQFVVGAYDLTDQKSWRESIDAAGLGYLEKRGME